MRPYIMPMLAACGVSLALAEQPEIVYHTSFDSFVAADANAAAPVQQAPQKDIRRGLAMDVNVLYSISAAPDSRYDCDMIGCELGTSYYFTSRQAVTLDLYVGADHQTFDLWNDHVNPGDDPFDRVDVALMGGYRYNLPLGKRCGLSFGVKGGLDVQRLAVKKFFGELPNPDKEYRASGTNAGIGYAGYVDFNLALAPEGRFYVGYQYRGATTKPVAEDNFYHDRYKAGDIRWHELRAGFEFKF